MPWPFIGKSNIALNRRHHEQNCLLECRVEELGGMEYSVIFWYVLRICAWPAASNTLKMLAPVLQIVEAQESVRECPGTGKAVDVVRSGKVLREESSGCDYVDISQDLMTSCKMRAGRPSNRGGKGPWTVPSSESTGVDQNRQVWAWE